jgi:hypothetical protein
MTVGVGKGFTTDPDVNQPLAPQAIAVRYNDHIGIVMDGFEKFNQAWFAFAAIPSKANLTKVTNKFAALIADPRPLIVIPMDLEQPYVGSVMGQELWTIFFDALARRGFTNHIVRIEDILGALREAAVPIKQPHRILTKWTSHIIQIRYLQRLAQLAPRTPKEHLLFSIASTSDLLSSWNRYVTASIKSAAIIKCQDRMGREVTLSQGHNKPLQEKCLAACQVLERKDETLTDKLGRIEQPNGLVLRLAEWAAERSL